MSLHTPASSLFTLLNSAHMIRPRLYVFSLRPLRGHQIGLLSCELNQTAQQEGAREREREREEKKKAAGRVGFWVIGAVIFYLLANHLPLQLWLVLFPGIKTDDFAHLITGSSISLSHHYVPHNAYIYTQYMSVAAAKSVSVYLERVFPFSLKLWETEDRNTPINIFSYSADAAAVTRMERVCVCVCVTWRDTGSMSAVRSASAH